MTQVNPLIPMQSNTQLPGGDFRAPTGVVEGTTPSVPQPGTVPSRRTASGSGVFGAPGSITPLTQPVRDIVVVLKNPTDTDFRMRYLTVEYRIAAHDQLVVQWEVLCSFMGSPEVMNMGPRRMDRKNVFDKLRVKYGAYYDDALWEQNKPKLEAYRVSGERILTVVDDPDGLSVTTSNVTQQQQIATEAAMIEMQRQMAGMQALIAQMSGQAQSTPQSSAMIQQMEQPPTDAPEAPDYIPGGVNQGPIQPAPAQPTPTTSPNLAPPIHPGAVMVPPVMAPPPVAGMTPQMPVRVPSLPPNLADDPAGASGQPQGATVDSPANQVRVS